MPIVQNSLNIFLLVREKVLHCIEQLTASGILPTGLSVDRVTCEPPREEKFGDMSTNAAMVLARDAKLPPLVIAEKLAEVLKLDPWVQQCHVAAPGFVNVTLNPPVWHAHLQYILSLKTAYGNSTLGQGQRINVEFVSSNPTGPIHAGHARIAVVGDVLCRLLEKTGHEVIREFYINDAGNQIDLFAHSVYFRYQELLGATAGATLPEDGYQGDYIIPIAQRIVDKDGPRWLDQSKEHWHPHFARVSIEMMMSQILDALRLLDVHYDVFSSEKALIQKGAIHQAIHILESKGLIYQGILEPPKGLLLDDWEPRMQLLFRATQFGDDVDRPLKKSDGTWTYFASDIAYHLNKWQRCHSTDTDSGHHGQLINVWGADHGGYVKRMQSALTAVTDGAAHLDVIICQLVNFFDNGKAVRMSKRSGTFIPVEEVIDAVGKDATRFMMMTRKSDMTLDFDFAKVKEQSKDNPVFYVQYAHARACSVKRQAEKLGEHLFQQHTQSNFCHLLRDDAEFRLIKKLSEWPRMVELSAKLREPHRLAFYLYDLASTFHVLWNKGKDDATLRFIVLEDLELTQARLSLVEAMRCIVASGLSLFGVTAVEEMH